jgi:hypothetical protein
MGSTMRVNGVRAVGSRPPLLLVNCSDDFLPELPSLVATMENVHPSAAHRGGLLLPRRPSMGRLPLAPLPPHLTALPPESAEVPKGKATTRRFWDCRGEREVTGARIWWRRAEEAANEVEEVARIEKIAEGGGLDSLGGAAPHRRWGSRQPQALEAAASCPAVGGCTVASAEKVAGSRRRQWPVGVEEACRSWEEGERDDISWARCDARRR